MMGVKIFSYSRTSGSVARLGTKNWNSCVVLVLYTRIKQIVLRKIVKLKSLVVGV